MSSPTRPTVNPIRNGDNSSNGGPQNRNVAAAPPIPAVSETTSERHNGQRELCRSRRQRAGTRNTATSNAAVMAKVLVQARGENSLKSRPVRKNTGRKLTIVVETPVTTAGATSCVASTITSVRLRGSGNVSVLWMSASRGE